MQKFDTKVQYIKYQVLREVAKHYMEGTLMEELLNIPENISPSKIPSIRCCVYKERAIIMERLKNAMGGKQERKNPIEVLKIACDQCPVGGYEVTAACRGCLAHRCEEICKFGAITFDHNHTAHIDKSKCVECGQCAKVCPFSAIINHIRPCQMACKVNAITINKDNVASIDDDKCISCGACVYQCPFGAIMDKSNILHTIDLLKNCKSESDYKLCAVVAPSISSQFTYAKLGHVIAGLKKLGFDMVVEAAAGADMVAALEARELFEKGFLISSCCPSFVSYIEKEFPDLLIHVSKNMSPMAMISKYIKENIENTKVVFVGPCMSKKMEAENSRVQPYVDSVITFEELQALFDCFNIEIVALEEEVLNDASIYGRTVARSGGLAEAIEQAGKEQNLNLELKACVCSGIEACKVALLKKSKNLLDANFIEGMVCVGGCIGGSGCLTHGIKDKTKVDEYGECAKEKEVTHAIHIITALKNRN